MIIDIKFNININNIIINILLIVMMFNFMIIIIIMNMMVDDDLLWVRMIIINIITKERPRCASEWGFVGHQ